MSVNKQAVLDVLNSLDVIEKQGGEDAYMLVRNTPETRARLIEAGVTEKEIADASDDDGETFCAISVAFNGNYADTMRDWWFYLWGPIDDELRHRVIDGAGTPEDAERLLRALEPQLFS